jgi:hypothetical protein
MAVSYYTFAIIENAFYPQVLLLLNKNEQTAL